MILEELVNDEVSGIQNIIIKKIGKSKDETFDITEYFTKRKEAIEKNDLQILLYFKNKKNTNFSAMATYLTKEEVARILNMPIEDANPVIQIILFGENREYLLNTALFHELVHTIDMLKIGGKKSKMRKSYIDVMRNKDGPPKDFLTPYLSNNLEYNQFINEIMNKYKNDKNFKNSFNTTKTYFGLLQLIFKEKKGIDIIHLSKDTAFKKKILSRLVKEGAKINLAEDKKLDFTTKVKNWLST